MRFIPEKNNNNIKAASSDERDLAPGLTANGGFRKTGNGEQYAFKENIEGYIKIIYMFQTSCCQLVAL